MWYAKGHQRKRGEEVLTFMNAWSYHLRGLFDGWIMSLPPLSIEPHGLELLMTYTTFHIGLYMSLVTALIASETFGKAKHWTIRWAILCLILAGACGGLIAVNAAEYDITLHDNTEKPFFDGSYALTIWIWSSRFLRYPYLSLTEHFLFWLGISPLSATVLCAGGTVLTPDQRPGGDRRPTICLRIWRTLFRTITSKTSKRHKMEKVQMTREEWERFCSNIKEAMATHVKPFSTPISMSREQGHGVAWATGSYIGGVRGIQLITAAHVFEDVPDGGRLAHLPSPGGDYIAVGDSPDIAPWPVEAATIDVPSIPKSSLMRAVLSSSIEQVFSAEEGELLFWIGFPGYTLERHDALAESRRRRTWFGELEALGVPMLSQAVRGWNGDHKAFDRERHVALYYPSAAKKTVDTPPVALPHPKGMSGSLLWDTKAVRTFSQGQGWSPELARVCGLVWAALDDPEVIFATKIEHIRSGLPKSVGLIG